MIERLEGPSPTTPGWYYARLRNDEIEPVYFLGPQVYRILDDRVYSVKGFNWFGPVDVCKELKRSE
jgi:hypothetical protein